MPVSVIIVHQGENVYFLAQMHTKCVLKYQTSTHCAPNVTFADYFGSTGHLLETFLIFPSQLLDTVQTSPRHLRLQIKLNSMKKIEVVSGWTVLSGNNTTSWLHLASWNLPDSQLS